MKIKNIFEVTYAYPILIKDKSKVTAQVSSIRLVAKDMQDVLQFLDTNFPYKQTSLLTRSKITVLDITQIEKVYII